MFIVVLLVLFAFGSIYPSKVNYLYMEGEAYVNFYNTLLFCCLIASKYLYVKCAGYERKLY